MHTDYITRREVSQIIERCAPLSLQEEYDNCGLQVGNLSLPVRRILIALDVTEETVYEAKQKGAEMIVSHHPLLFRGLKRISPQDYISRTVIEAIKNDITIYAAHTNLDNAPEGVNKKLANVLGLTALSPLAPLPSSRTAGLSADMAEKASSGIIGKLPQEMSEKDFISLLKERLHTPCIKYNHVERSIRKVALCGGAGSNLIGCAISKGADAFLTGEIGYHLFFGHPEILLLEAGHYETEQHTTQLLKEIITQELPQLECFISEKSKSPINVS